MFWCWTNQTSRSLFLFLRLDDGASLCGMTCVSSSCTRVSPEDSSLTDRWLEIKPTMATLEEFSTWWMLILRDGGTICFTLRFHAPPLACGLLSPVSVCCCRFPDGADPWPALTDTDVGQRRLEHMTCLLTDSGSGSTLPPLLFVCVLHLVKHQFTSDNISAFRLFPLLLLTDLKRGSLWEWFETSQRVFKPILAQYSEYDAQTPGTGLMIFF